MTVLPELEQELRAAAQRTQPAPSARAPRRAPRARDVVVLALGVALTAASIAVAAGLRIGAPAPKTTGVGVPTAGPGAPLPDGARVLSLRVADPDGGPPWGVRVYPTSRRAMCWQLGRVVGGRLGVLGTAGAFSDDGRFHELPVERDQCRPLDANGNLFAYQGLIALSNGLTSRLSCRPRPWRGDGTPQPPCPDGALRHVRIGFLGPQAVRATLTGSGLSPRSVAVRRADQGAALFVERDDPAGSGRQGEVLVAYRDGSTRAAEDVAPFESVGNPPPSSPPPPGYADPARGLPDPRSLRRPVHLSRRRVNRNDIYTVRYRVPVSVRRYGLEYFIVIDGPRRGEGRNCERPMRFGGFNTSGNVRAGQLITAKITPGVALRWGRGWCPGRYRGAVVLHDRAHVVGRFSFSAR